VLGHLIHGEKADWIPRVRIILEYGASRPFVPFDREAMRREPQDRTIERMLAEFADLRAGNLVTLRGMNLTSRDLQKQGTHPKFGAVTLEQLLAAWVVHDLDHWSQIARVMAKQYTGEVGPWTAFLSILGDRVPR
jgi:hypothetical protein